MPYEAQRSGNLMSNEKPNPPTNAGRCRRLATATEYDSREMPEPSHCNRNCNHNCNHHQNTKQNMQFGHRKRNVACNEQCPETHTAGATKKKPEQEESPP